LSLAVGLSVVQSLHPRLQLKWPNDLWLEDRKMGGILIETLSQGPLRYTVIGIGINLGVPEAAGLRTPPSGLRELQPQAQAPSVLAALGLPLVHSILTFAQTGFAPLCQAFAQRDALFGRELLCSDGLSGIAQGVDAQGALLLQTDQGLRKISSAEVSVRPVATAIAATAAQQPALPPLSPLYPPHPL
jgi:BirA family biotin operon repressor/biotin-[acetyl-CoA-carboxylase] ligase